jgi:hypothetical protein
VEVVLGKLSSCSDDIAVGRAAELVASSETGEAALDVDKGALGI